MQLVTVWNGYESQVVVDQEKKIGVHYFLLWLKNFKEHIYLYLFLYYLGFMEIMMVLLLLVWVLAEDFQIVL